MARNWKEAARRRKKQFERDQAKLGCLRDEPVDKIPHKENEHNYSLANEVGIELFNMWRLRVVMHNNLCKKNGNARNREQGSGATLDDFGVAKMRYFAQSQPARTFKSWKQSSTAAEKIRKGKMDAHPKFSDE